MGLIRTDRRPRLFPILLLLVALPLVLGGAQLASLGGSLYYLPAGLAIIVSAVLLWGGKASGSLTYGGLLVVTCAWALFEAGTDLWALAPRVLPFATLGLWLLTPWARRGLYIGQQVPPLFQSLSVKGITAALVVSVIAVIINDMGWDVSPMSERAGVTEVNARTDWPSYGNTNEGTRFSPLDQINTANVSDLEVAWTYRTKIGGTFKATPIQIGDLLYVCGGGNIIVALDAGSGELRWQFDPKVNPDQMRRGRYFTTGCRGVSYFQAPAEYSGECRERIITATTDARMFAVDAHTGKSCQQFGNAGQVDLSKNMGGDPPMFNFVTSPPGIVSGKAVVGGWVMDNVRVKEPSGVVRAFDAITGEFAWAWDMGRPGINTEPEEGEIYTRGTPNVWSLFSVDEALGLIYAPTGNETPDYFGGYRLDSSEQFASSVVALDGNDGSLRWSFQTVHHDIWDYDVPSQPTLIDLPGKNGEVIPALLQPTKRGEVFMLNRLTGEPIAQIEERPVPQQGGVDEDWVAATQPFAVDFPHFRQDLTEADMWGVTPLDQMWCRIEFRKMRYEGHFTVPGTDTILQFPGNGGGYNWGSVSVDEVNHLMVASPLIMGNQLTLTPRDQLPEGFSGNQQGTPYSVRTRPFMSPLGAPCLDPPYGILAVIDLETLQLLWQRPIGSARDIGPLGIKSRFPWTIGTPNLTGTLTTKSGLIFIAGTLDTTVRAIDLGTGKELWQDALPNNAQGTPMSYLSAQGNKQTIVVTVPASARGTGPEEDPLGGYIIAYRLPD
ncbi:MAG TPA: membrane-bound PQQ-dependent dehydrogenase, glucose/quinate/shikimate family [Pseudomonadales bacterium]|nr:membrane-bound PQQ-dependent dehydrogenase, glucose/quinate/shikimate family [Pseudomonadales bacterium]